MTGCHSVRLIALKRAVDPAAYFECSCRVFRAQLTLPLAVPGEGGEY
jgi:hypothetical protein